jgi:Zn-dependent M28 family amino/carboxypeptidase
MKLLAPLFAMTLLSAAPPTVQEPVLRAHLAFLADDLLEGRGTGQRGGDLAVAYLEAQVRALGLKPVAGGSYRQRVDVLGERTDLGRSAVTFRGQGGTLAPVLLEDLVATSGRGEAVTDFEAPVLFVGYGIDAPEERWDDYKGVDCRGKLLLMLVNEPAPTKDEPGLFDGESLSRYGRWTTKFEEAARKGAAGVLLVHTTEGATYDWSVVRAGFQGEKFMVAKGPRLAPLQGWVTEAFARKLAAAGGQDLDALRALASSRSFRPVPLAASAKVHMESAIRTFPQYNVAALLPGTDLASEALVLSAHWDHLGIQDGAIYNGAVDNASAVAALLAMAQAETSAGIPTRRSQVFLFTCGEEQGLLGAEGYVRSPLWPLKDTVADLNLESLNWVGPSRDIEFLGGERSTLQDMGRRVAESMGMVLRRPEPDRQGLFFRSDHYPFVKAGIPALSPGFSLLGQRDYLEDPEGSRARARTYQDRYHRPADRYDPAWDLRGMVQQAQFILELGRLVADADGRPAWKPRPER